MLTYVRSGMQHYTQADSVTGLYHGHGPEWEFEACLEGCMAPCLTPKSKGRDLRERTLWVFPGQYAHGWYSPAPVERVVFHFTEVPKKLMQFLPSRGYYRLALTDADCDRLRVLARDAIAAHEKPTEYLDLQDQTLAGELSLLALREMAPRPLKDAEYALQKANMALAYFKIRLSECPKEADVAQAIHISPSYLRRLFQRAYDITPRQAFLNLRMETVENLLMERLTLATIAERVGFSSESSLSRAIKHHFGCGAVEMRKRLEHGRDRFARETHQK